MGWRGIGASRAVGRCSSSQAKKQAAKLAKRLKKQQAKQARKEKANAAAKAKALAKEKAKAAADAKTDRFPPPARAPTRHAGKAQWWEARAPVGR